MRTAHAAAAASCLLIYPFALLGALATRAHAHEPDEKPDANPGLTAPVLIERVEPIYPETARTAGIGGTVSLELTVDETGAVAAVKLARPSGFAALDDAAITAARRFRFRPATRDGRPIASTVLFDQRFNLRPHLAAEIAAAPAAVDETPAAPPPAPAPLPERAETEHRSSYESTVTAREATSASSSSTVRNADFELRPRTSPNDLLRVVPGLLASQHQGGGKADQLFLRGFDADHGTDVAVFVDGVPINLPSHAHGQGYTDLHWLIPEAVERIDVEKGAYDVRYGDFATAGAINLVTRDRFESSSLSYTLGMFPTLGTGKLAAVGRFVGIAAPTLPGWAAKLHPWVAFEAAYDEGPFINPEHLKRYNVFSKITYDIRPRTQIGVFVSAYGSGWYGSGQIPAREVAAGRLDQFGAEDPTEGGLTERQMFTAFLKHNDLLNDVEVTFYVTRYRLALFNDFTFYLEDPVHGSEIEQDDSRLYTGANVAWHFHRHWRLISFRTTLGVNARYDGVHVDRWDDEARVRLQRHVDTSPAHLSGNNDDIDVTNLSGYLEEDVYVNKWVRAVGGLRVDYFGFNVSDLNAPPANESGSKQKVLVSPKASLVVSPLPERFDLYLNFGMGFHSNMAQVALRDGTPHFDPTTHVQDFSYNAVPRYYSGEVGARVHLFNRVDATCALWASYLENETVFDADHASFVPAAATRRLGFDFDARARIFHWLHADIDLSQADAQAVPDHGAGGVIALAPRLYITGGLTAKHIFDERIGMVRGGLRLRYLGERPVFDTFRPEYRANPAGSTAQGWFIVDLYGAWRWRFLEASLMIQNLFNTTWREAQIGNHSCTRDETYNAANANYGLCGITNAVRPGVADLHFTPGVPLNLQFTLKAFF
jgi:TonB family protein